MSYLQISNQAVREVSTTQKAMIGQLAMTPDGRKFRYASNGAAAMVAGNLYVRADDIADHQNRLIDDVVTAPAVNDKKVTIKSIGGTALTADQYLDAYLVTQDNAGEGYEYRVAGHIAYGTSASDVVVDLAESLAVALTSASEVSLTYTSWHKVVIADTTQTDVPAGIAKHTTAASGYGWLQTGGPCAVFCDTAFATGENLTIGASTNGQVEAFDAVGEPIIGQSIDTGVADEYVLAYLTID